MSLITAPYKPAKIEEETLYKPMNYLEELVLVYSDGSSVTLPLYRALLVTTMLLRRNSPVALQQTLDGQRYLVLENGPNGLRGTPEILDVLKSTNELLNAEIADAQKMAARRAAAESGGEVDGEAAESGADGGQQAQADADEEPVGEGRPGNRFRRGRR